MTNEKDEPKLDESYIEYTKTHLNNNIKNDLKTLLAVIVGSALIGINIKLFLNQAKLLPAGINGVSSLIQRLIFKFMEVKVPFMPISLALNFFPVILAFKTVGKKFTIFSVISIFIISLATDLFPHMPVTHDWLLIAIFGGLLNGFANSMILRRNASTGGFDFVAMYFSVKKGIYTFNYVFMANAVIILISGFFFGADSALYTVIYQFVSNQVIKLMYNRYSKKTLLIITSKPQEISDEIMRVTNHASTIIEGIGGYTGEKREIVYSIVGANEVDLVRGVIKNVDPKSFVNTIESDTITGNFYQRPIG